MNMFERFLPGGDNQEDKMAKDPAEMKTVAEVDEAIQAVEEQIELDATLNPDQLIDSDQEPSMKASHEERLARLKERREEVAQEEDADLLV